jgi:hypothetical protein
MRILPRSGCHASVLCPLALAHVIIDIRCNLSHRPAPQLARTCFMRILPRSSCHIYCPLSCHRVANYNAAAQCIGAALRRDLLTGNWRALRPADYNAAG